MVWWRVLEIIRSKEAGHIAMVAEHSQTDRDNLNKTWNQQNFQEQKERISERKKNNKLETNSKKSNSRYLYRGKNECKKGYQLRTSTVKNENGDMLADSHSILNR